MQYIPIVIGIVLIIVGVLLLPIVDTKPVEKIEDTPKTGEMRIVEDSDGSIRIEKYHRYPGWWPHSSVRSIEEARVIKANWDKIIYPPEITTKVIE